MSTTNPTTSRQAPVAKRSTQDGPSGQRSHAAPPGVRTGSGRFSALLAEGAGRAHARPAHHPSPGDVLAAGRTSAAVTGPGNAAAMRGAMRPRSEELPAGARPSATRESAADGDRSLLAPFLPAPSVLAPPLSATPVAAPAPVSAHARAEAAALAERLVRSMRIGKIGRDGHEVRLRLDLGSRSDVEVRLRHVDGALSATLVSDAASCADAEQLASALRRELTERGIVCEEVEVSIG